MAIGHWNGASIARLCNEAEATTVKLYGTRGARLFNDRALSGACAGAHASLNVSHDRHPSQQGLRNSALR
jgi:hypothetical protein